MTRPGRPPGRPRDGSIDARALAAARTLLAEEGYEATTVTAVAERAGVHASALYRRWPSRTALVEAAVSPADTLVLATPTGNLRRDLHAFLEVYDATFSRPEARAAAPGLLAHYQSAPVARTGTPWSTRPHFRALLAAAPEGTVDPEVDPDDVFDVLLGALLVRTLLPAALPQERPLERLVDLVHRMVRRV